MQETNAAPPSRFRERPPRRRTRLWLGVVALVLAGHALLLGGLDAVPIGSGHETMGSPLTVRTIAAEGLTEPASEPPAAAADEPKPAPTAPPSKPPSPARPRPPRAVREPAQPALQAPPVEVAANAPVDTPAVGAEPVAAPASASASIVAEAGSAPAVDDVAAEATAAAAAAVAQAASQPLLLAGEQPPPVYRTQLPPPATLRYEVRRGFSRGSGEIRWRREGEGYSLVLEARILGITLLRWSSEGGIDAAGIAPQRFLDQRFRRGAQAANFQRESGKVTFSGPSNQWPIYAGTQDELSWMIQLAGIAAAEPGLLVEGGRITLVVVGARGEARVWNVRYAGRENVETASGTVHAVKLVRDLAGPYDRGYEIWLDPERGYLPAHVTRRNADGTADFDILLERVEPAP